MTRNVCAPTLAASLFNSAAALPPEADCSCAVLGGPAALVAARGARSV